jgi:epoxide hydrolase
VRPFRFAVPPSDLDDLRERPRTRWPDAATVDGWTQGVPLDYARDLCAYWWAQLMATLDIDRYGAAGGDWGAFVTTALGTGDPEHVVGIHVTMPSAARPEEGSPPLTPAEEAALADRQNFVRRRSGYSAIQSTRPQTLGYGLADSPVAQCLWVVEKFWDWTDGDGPPETVIRRDRLLDDVMFYWLPDAGASSARLYWESFGRPQLDPVRVPTGVTLFPKELARLPRSWVERRYTDLRHWSEPAVGGHFASMEQPAVYVDELRTFFRPLR